MHRKQPPCITLIFPLSLFFVVGQVRHCVASVSKIVLFVDILHFSHSGMLKETLAVLGSSVPSLRRRVVRTRNLS